MTDKGNQKDNQTISQQTEQAQTPGPVEEQQPDLAQMQARLEALQKERDELIARLQRVSADYANYQKRVPRQIADSTNWAQEGILKSLLPVCDHLEMAIKQAGANTSAESILNGIRIVYDQLQSILRSYDVQPIKAVDECFDPLIHEAMMTRSEPSKADKIILEECQKGYTRGDRVLRPSRVVVNTLCDVGQSGQEVQQSN